MTEIQLKRGTALNLSAVNPVLAAGEPCWESDTNKFKIGDGTTAWADLPYHVAEAAVKTIAQQRAYGLSLLFG